MRSKVILPRGTLVKFNYFFLFLGFLICFQTRTARALPFNADFFPKSHSLEVEQAPLYASLSDCSSSQGRFFNFSSNTSFRLGGVGLFFFEDYNSQNSVLETDRLKVSLFKGDLPSSLNALVFRNPFQNNDGSYNKPLSLFGNGQARGVFFELIRPVWLNQNQTYSVLVECQNSSSVVAKIYGGGNTTGARSFDSNSLSLGNEANLKVPYFQLYSKNDGLVLVTPAALTPPLRPVIFVHGLGGLPSDFSDYASSFISQNWASSNVLTFDFGLKSDGSYNNLVGLNDLIARLRANLLALSASYKAEGGDGKVDLVAYSSGSILTRNYLGFYKENSLLRKFVAIGGLFRGSFLADLETGKEISPGAGTKIPLSLGKLLLPSLKALNPMTQGRAPNSELFKPDLGSSGGPVLSFQKDSLPLDVSYYSLRGEIKARNSQTLFGATIKSESSLGDGVTLSSSADDLPNPTATPYQEYVDLTRSLNRQSATASAAVNLPDFSKLRYFHSNLLKSAEIRNRVLEILKN